MATPDGTPTSVKARRGEFDWLERTFEDKRHALATG
jgi:hypothetical protein